MHVLLSEGASTSAREAITALGLNGHEIEVCDPNPLCLGRFSRFGSRFHCCPGLGTDPHGYLSFILYRITGGRFDVLLPIYEQGFLFARLQEQILPHVAVALPSFDSYERAHSKIGFSRLLSELDLPQPSTRFVASAEELLRIESFPYVLKAAIGTASRGTWVIDNRGELQAAMDELQRSGAFAEPVLVQELAAGHVEHAQAVFCQGALVGFHGCRQLSRGAGGGDATKLSILRPTVRSHMARVGEHLRWHGALSLDYILQGTIPLYIDCNPRLVEPMSAFLAGLDLTDVLLRVSRGDALSSAAGSRQGVRTHSAIQVLLGCAMRDQRRSSSAPRMLALVDEPRCLQGEPGRTHSYTLGLGERNSVDRRGAVAAGASRCCTLSSEKGMGLFTGSIPKAFARFEPWALIGRQGRKRDPVASAMNTYGEFIFSKSRRQGDRIAGVLLRCTCPPLASFRSFASVRQFDRCWGQSRHCAGW